MSTISRPYRILEKANEHTFPWPDKGKGLPVVTERKACLLSGRGNCAQLYVSKISLTDEFSSDLDPTPQTFYVCHMDPGNKMPSHILDRARHPLRLI